MHNYIMMGYTKRLYLANSSSQNRGGGRSCIANFKKGMGNEITEDYAEATHYFISGATMVSRDEVLQAKQDGKKIVLRVDNAVRNSRNRNTGMSRMKDFAEWADLVVFQSYWAFGYLGEFLKLKRSAVILNGIDLDLFRSEPGQENIILYSRFNRDETKNWEVARYWFSRHHTPHQRKLLIVGNFSDELRDGNFDFYNGEQYEYLGALDAPNMAKIYRLAGKFLYTYYNDACSNSLIEALCSGCEIVGDEYYRTTGGAPEILDNFYEHGREYFSLRRMCNEYREVLNAV